MGPGTTQRLQAGLARGPAAAQPDANRTPPEGHSLRLTQRGRPGLPNPGRQGRPPPVRPSGGGSSNRTTEDRGPREQGDNGAGRRRGWHAPIPGLLPLPGPLQRLRSPHLAHSDRDVPKSRPGRNHGRHRYLRRALRAGRRWGPRAAERFGGVRELHSRPPETPRRPQALSPRPRVRRASPELLIPDPSARRRLLARPRGGGLVPLPHPLPQGPRRSLRHPHRPPQKWTLPRRPAPNTTHPPPRRAQPRRLARPLRHVRRRANLLPRPPEKDPHLHLQRRPRKIRPPTRRRTLHHRRRSRMTSTMPFRRLVSRWVRGAVR